RGGWPTGHRTTRRVEMMPSLTDSQTRPSSMARRPMAPIGFEFRTADGRVHPAMLESGARVPPHWLEAVHSRLRAAQVVQVSKYAHSNRLLAAQLQSSAHPLSCLIELSCS